MVGDVLDEVLPAEAAGLAAEGCQAAAEPRAQRHCRGGPGAVRALTLTPASGVSQRWKLNCMISSGGESVVASSHVVGVPAEPGELA